MFADLDQKIRAALEAAYTRGRRDALQEIYDKMAPIAASPAFAPPPHRRNPTGGGREEMILRMVDEEKMVTAAQLIRKAADRGHVIASSSMSVLLHRLVANGRLRRRGMVYSCVESSHAR